MGLTQPKPPVDTGHPVVFLPELSRGHDRPKIRLRVEVVAGPANYRLRGGAKPRVSAIIEPAGRFVIRHDEPQRGVPDLAR